MKSVARRCAAPSGTPREIRSLVFMMEMIINSNLNGGRYFASTLSSAADPALRGEPSDVEHPSTLAQQQFEHAQKPDALLRPKMLLGQPCSHTLRLDGQT
jgi:hypothetical protein